MVTPEHPDMVNRVLLAKVPEMIAVAGEAAGPVSVSFDEQGILKELLRL